MSVDAFKNQSGDKKDKKTATSTTDNPQMATRNVDEVEEVVFVLQADGTVRRVKVRTDIQDISYIEVVDGLKPDDKVITGPYTTVSKSLRNGMKVKVVPKEELFEVKK